MPRLRYVTPKPHNLILDIANRQITRLLEYLYCTVPLIVLGLSIREYITPET